MAAFDSIPDEILLNINSHVGSIKDLAALSIQCRRFHDIIDMPARKRFHRIRLGRSTTSCPVSRRHAIAGLLLEILKQPKLGQYVSQLEVDSPPMYTRRIQPLEKTENENVRLIMAAFRAAGFSDDEYTRALLAMMLRDGELGGSESLREDEEIGVEVVATFEEVVAVLLIPLCPNIEILRISEPYWPLAELLKRINSKNSELVALQKLREVRFLTVPFDKREYTPHCFLVSMRSFHRLPSIESISIHSICIPEGTFFQLAPRKSNISKIFIDKSSMWSNEIANIIRHPKTLKEFKFAAGGQLPTFDKGDSEIQPKTLGKALQCHKSSLRVLDLDVDTTLRCWNVDWEAEELESESDDYDAEPGFYDSDLDVANIAEPTSHENATKFGLTIGSFHDFTALTHLSIGVELLLGQGDAWHTRQLSDLSPPIYCLVDRLPPNLEFLCIRGFDGNRDEHSCYAKIIFEMMEMQEEYLPSLKEVQGVTGFIPSSGSVTCVSDQEDPDSWASSSDPDDPDGPDNNGHDVNDMSEDSD